MIRCSQRASWLQLTFVVVAIFCCFAADSRGGGYQYDVGVSKVDITPGYPIRLNGFGSRREESEGITQRIWAKALAIGADEAKPDGLKANTPRKLNVRLHPVFLLQLLKKLIRRHRLFEQCDLAFYCCEIAWR